VIRPVVAIVGNPNCGKTTLFNAFTGTRQRVGNWPGVTVECKMGNCTLCGEGFHVVDLPGIYSLDRPSDSDGLDEGIARDYLMSGAADVVVNTVDATNLERTLNLTLQLLERGVPVVVALNMMDRARGAGVEVDHVHLSRRLGCPVVPVAIVHGEGIGELTRTIHRVARERRPPTVEREVFEDKTDTPIADQRHAFAQALAAEVVSGGRGHEPTISDRIDRLVLHHWIGPLVFLGAMYLMFFCTINLGGAFIDAFDIAFNTLFVDGIRALLTAFGAPRWLEVILADGVGGGIRLVATFVPIIGFLYLFLAIMEDSGYMARAAFLMDRLMSKIGLPGKSFVPLIVGFGCNVPAVMAARTLERERERILTVAMAPFMSCGARLTVYALFAAAFFPTGGSGVVFALYLIGIAVAVGTGLVLKRTLLAGDRTPFVMDLPPYHRPRAKAVCLHAWIRLKSFVLRAGKVIVLAATVLSFLNSWGPDGSFGNENTDRSALSFVGRSIVPAFEPMGIRSDNWPATVGIFIGVFAKETVVGALDSLYGASRPERDRDDFAPLAGMARAMATIPTNLADLAARLTDPLGLDIVALDNLDESAAAQGVDIGTFGSMAARFDGGIGAFAYLLFILLYIPCVATLGTMHREVGLGWALFNAGWTTGIAYAVAVVTYQAGTFLRHPATSAVWIVALMSLVAGAVLLMRAMARPNRSALPAPAE
jgi:ferrous iron transport protein B